MDGAATIGQAQGMLADHTESPLYNQLVAQELEHYSSVLVTEGLTEGGVHAHRASSYYFDYLYSNYLKLSFYDAVCEAASGKDDLKVLSLGCGYGGHDLNIARRLGGEYELIALDLNPQVFAAAAQRARLEGLNIRFEALDLNRVRLDPGSFDVIYAVASLHHILNLEHLFGQLRRGLKPEGRLVIFDVIGKTQVQFWRENIAYAAGVVKKLPRRFRPAVGRRRIWRRWLFDPYRVIPRFVERQVQIGMEGIRQEEIVPLLDRAFRAEKLFYFDAYLRVLFTNTFLGPRFDPANAEDRALIESLVDEEMEVIASGKLRPTEVFGIYSKKSA